MKHIIAFCFYTLLIPSLNAQINNSEAFFDGTYNKAYISKNKVKEITIDLLINNQKSTQLICEFDRKGFLKKMTFYGKTGNKIHDYTFEYNKYGDWIKRINFSYEFNKTYVDTIERTYKNSKLVSERNLSSIQIISIYSYNLKGQKNTSRTIMGNDTASAPKIITHYLYSYNGRLYRKEEFTSFNNGTTSPARITSYLYNSLDNVVQIKRSDAPTYFIMYDNKQFLRSIKIKMPEDLKNVEMVDNYNYSFWD